MRRRMANGTGLVVIVGAALLAGGCTAGGWPQTTAAAPERAGAPRVVVGPLTEAGTCRVSWSPPGGAGGVPVLRYVVTTESPSVPPQNGVSIGTAIQVARTTDTTASLPDHWSIRVAAERATGTGPEAGGTCPPAHRGERDDDHDHD